MLASQSKRTAQASKCQQPSCATALPRRLSHHTSREIRANVKTGAFWQLQRACKLSPAARLMSTLPCLQAYNSSMPLPESNTLGLVSSGTAAFACVAAAAQPLVTLSTRWTHLGLYSFSSHHAISLQNCSTAANNIRLNEAASTGSKCKNTQVFHNHLQKSSAAMGVGTRTFQAMQTANETMISASL